MGIETFFSRPGLVCEIADRIKNDLKFAKNRILGAAFSFTDDEYIKLVISSPVPIKKFIINEDDKHNFKDKIKDITYIKLGMGDSKIFNIQMHHKFLIIDDILWVGSYNLSKNATLNNWENIMRITDVTVISEYISEFKKMYIFGQALQNSDIIAYKLFDKSMSECNNCKTGSLCYFHKHINCKECNDKIEDPFEHFRVKIKVIQDAEEYFDECDGEYHSNVFNKKKNNRIDNIVLECINKDKSTKKLKCPICGTFNWEKNLSKIDFYNDVKLFYGGTDIDWDEERNIALGTKIVYSQDGSEEKFDKSEEMCLECLYNIVEERWIK